MATRRAILITGGAAVVISGAGWALTRAPHEALEPWRKAEKGFGDPRLDARAGIFKTDRDVNDRPICGAGLFAASSAA